jgi:hypothetical protein
MAVHVRGQVFRMGLPVFPDTAVKCLRRILALPATAKRIATHNLFYGC